MKNKHILQKSPPTVHTLGKDAIFAKAELFDGTAAQNAAIRTRGGGK
ncbi:hypothetical protein [Alistipes sp.]|nr:hypothetical protein [Alistipes sp.]